jgi:hypothetical protein
MSPQKKTTSKASIARPLVVAKQAEGEPKIVRATYDDTPGLLEKDGETLKWGEIYHMFKKSNFSVEAEDPDELQVFKNIRKSSIFRVATHPTIFPYADAITWILKNIDVNDRYMLQCKERPHSIIQT